MKKLFLLIPLLLSSISSFAQYGSSSDSNIPGMVIFIGLVLIVAGLLQVILFFKLWSMTNNVQKIKNGLKLFEFEEGFEYNSKIKRFLLLGNKAEARELMINRFISQVKERYQTDSIIDKKNELQLDLELIGEKLPKVIECLYLASDYNNLFLKGKNLYKGCLVSRNSDKKLMHIRNVEYDGKMHSYICYTEGYKNKEGAYSEEEITRVNISAFL